MHKGALAIAGVEAFLRDVRKLVTWGDELLEYDLSAALRDELKLALDDLQIAEIRLRRALQAERRAAKEGT